MTLIRIIATFILIYLAFRLFTMYIFPWLLRWFINRQKEKFYEQNPHLRPDEPDKKKKPGTHFSGGTQTTEKPTDQIGEYIDFEEVKEETEKDKKKNNKTDKDS